MHSHGRQLDTIHIVRLQGKLVDVFAVVTLVACRVSSRGHLVALAQLNVA